MADTILAEVKRLPPMSDASARIMGLVSKDSVSAAEVTQIVSRDPALAAQILRVANSAVYRRKTDIESIQLAVSLLGNRTVVGIVMGYCMRHIYNKPLPGYDAPGGALWRHSIASALAAQMLCAYARKPVSMELAYTAGLLHAIGKSVISEYLKNSVGEMAVKLDQSADRDFLRAETELLGTNHCEVGVAMARQWHLPESLCECIAHYHKPSGASEPHRPLAYVVHVADCIAVMQGMDTGVDGMGYSMDPDYEQYLRFREGHEIEKIVLAVSKEFQKMIEGFELPGK